MDGCCERNKVSICLSIVVILLLILLAFIGVLFLGYIKISEETEECTNSPCVKSSAEIDELVDKTIDPCYDFYSFVCGKFQKISYEKQIDNLLNAERERMAHHIETLIVEPIEHDDPQPVRMQKIFFQACLNEEEIDEDHDQTLFRRLYELGEWPFLRRHNHWDEKNFNWVQMMIRARDMGLPFQWFLKVDLYEDADYELKLSHPDDCGVKPSNEYFDMQRNILEEFTRPGIDAIADFTYLAEFETKLNLICANLSSADISLRKIFHLRLDNTMPAFFLTSITGLTHKWRGDSVLAYDINYIFDLNQLLRVTPKAVQANYILWKMIQYFAPYSSKPIREKYAQYLNDISGKEISRFQFCLDDTKSKFKFVSEIVCLKQYTETSIQEAGEELAGSINQQILNHIESVEWRSNRTKESHLDLYENIENIVGGPTEMFEDSFLTKYLHVGRLVFISDNIIQMIVDWSQNTFVSKMKMIGEPATPGLDVIYEANSQWVVILDEQEQQLILPASSFHSILYNQDLPQYLNYGGLGTIIGTELIRGLHLLSKKQHDSYTGFEESKKCMIDNLQKSNKNLNASRLFYVNYESILGQELAYRAYQAYAEENEEPHLVNMPYTPNQLFWIKSSLNWCYHALPEEEEIIDMQKILKYRITETVKNSQFFASDFNCSSHAPMNPPNKCQLL